MKFRKNGETRKLVLAHLVREADADGGVIVAAAEIARLLSITPQAVQSHINALIAEGAIHRDAGIEVDRLGGHFNSYRLSESVMSA